MEPAPASLKGGARRGRRRLGRQPNACRVLVVDDDPQILAVIRLSLAKEGIDVLTTGTGAECLQAVEVIRPDLIVLDVLLPDLSGWEVLRRIRERSDVAVMFLTGRDSDVDKARGLDLGADDYVTKPFSLLEFEARVRALLRRSRRQVRDPAHDGAWAVEGARVG